MTSRRDTLPDRVARAQREIKSWDSRVLASMQLQGPTDSSRSTSVPITSMVHAAEPNADAVVRDRSSRKRGG